MGGFRIAIFIQGTICSSSIMQNRPFHLKDVYLMVQVWDNTFKVLILAFLKKPTFGKALLQTLHFILYSVYLPSEVSISTQNTDGPTDPNLLNNWQQGKHFQTNVPELWHLNESCPVFRGDAHLHISLKLRRHRCSDAPTIRPVFLLPKFTYKSI